MSKSNTGGVKMRTISELKKKLSEWLIDSKTVEFVMKIGEGAFGQVWLGKASQLPGKKKGKAIECAVKMMKSEP
jgi:hypothetical protein